jgi:rod shape-determining protein MreD
MISRLLITLLVALILTIVPLPDSLVQVRPPWVLLVVLYVQFYLPNYFNITLVFILGLILDSLLATVIGEHALSLCFVTWFANSKARRFSLFPIAQQMMFMGVFVLTYQGILFLIDSFLGEQAKFVTLVGAGLVGVLLWPWLRLLGENFLLTVRHSRPR